jgi:hypothetical protein
MSSNQVMAWHVLHQLNIILPKGNIGRLLS